MIDDTWHAVDKNHLDGILFLNVNALKEDALPILNIFPKLVSLEKVNYVYLLDLVIFLLVAYIVSH